MRTILHLISFLLLGLGALVVVVSLLAFAYAWLAPVQPPPSMNEGPALSGVVGLFLLVVGAVSFFVGLIISSVLRASRPPQEIVSTDWARQHKRLW